MTEDDGKGVYAVVAESKGEGPLLMETVGQSSSRAAALQRMRTLMAEHRVIRAAVVRLEPTTDGNELLLIDMKRMQK